MIMKTIIRGRDSGKAAELFAYARETGATVLTKNKFALRVKANSLGYDDVSIIGYEDLVNDNYDNNVPIVIHNGDDALQWLMRDNYYVNVIGFSATVEEN